MNYLDEKNNVLASFAEKNDDNNLNASQHDLGKRHAAGSLEKLPLVSRTSSLKPEASKNIYSIRAFQILADQPVSLLDLKPWEKGDIVISALADEMGNEHVLSRFKDDIWNLSPEILAVNRSKTTRRIFWARDIPEKLIDDAKIAVYCALRLGRNGIYWSAGTAASFGSRTYHFLRYLSGLGIVDFSGVKPIHVTNYINKQKNIVKPTTICNQLRILDLVWFFAKELNYPLQDHPFSGMSLYLAVGRVCASSANSGKSGKTPVIPPSVQQKLWTFCQDTLDKAEDVLLKRDCGAIDFASRSVIDIRDVVLYQLQICTGMRNSESTWIVNGCWRAESKVLQSDKNIIFHWINTREIKTSRGRFLDYLAPGELFKSLELLQRFAEPFQQRLADEAKWLEEILSSKNSAKELFSGEEEFLEKFERLHRIKQIGKHLMLTLNAESSDHLGDGLRVDVMSSLECNDALRRLARAAGVKWKLANHQCRRTFAWNIANSRLGRMGLVFIKWQFKHVSISWTQLYAANPLQDQALYEEFGDAMYESKTELITAWHNADSQLSGGAGKKLMETRAIPVRNLTQLIQATADTVVLRSTGHAWCMSGTQGCHGQGVYHPEMCGRCSQAIIDDSQGARWQMIHLENLRLAAVTDCGPAVLDKVKKAIAMSTQVLSDLRIPLPSEEQVSAYELEKWVQ